MGYMGSGKSSVGKLLAKNIGWQFIDLDIFIENRYHKSISRIFSEKDETFFREIEHNMLREVALFEQSVISTGGGAPCFHNNMTLMKQTGITVYLKVPIPELSKRLETSKQSRPLIKNKTKEELTAFIADNLKAREIFYNEADIILDMEKIPPPANLNGIVSQLEHDLRTFKIEL